MDAVTEHELKKLVAQIRSAKRLLSGFIERRNAAQAGVNAMNSTIDNRLRKIQEIVLAHIESHDSFPQIQQELVEILAS